MDSLDLSALSLARDWFAAGHAVWLVTVVDAWGSAPRPPGALLVLRGDGAVAGSVSGGCVEDDLVERVRSGGNGDRPEVLAYGVTSEQASRAGLACGGRLQVLVEPLRDSGWVAEVMDRVGRHERVRRTLSLADGSVSLATADRGDTFSFDGSTLQALHGPRWRLLVVGAGQLSQAVATMALALDFEVHACDPRDSYHAAWRVPGATLHRGMPDDVAVALGLDAHTAVAALSHDRKLDDLVLLEALKSPAFYVGALGSRRNDADRRERLGQFDLSADQIARLRGPIGLDLGGRTPAEIALSVMSEVVAVRHGSPLAQRRPVPEAAP